MTQDAKPKQEKTGKKAWGGGVFSIWWPGKDGRSPSFFCGAQSWPNSQQITGRSLVWTQSMSGRCVVLGTECCSVRRGWQSLQGTTHRISGPRSCPTQVKIQFLQSMYKFFPCGVLGPEGQSNCSSLLERHVSQMVTEGSSKKAYQQSVEFAHHLPEEGAQVFLHHQRPKLDSKEFLYSHCWWHLIWMVWSQWVSL
jgi:hypothetical protein